MKKNNKKGFTLIELLAVIVILAILATAAFTLVIPRINESRYKSVVTEASSILDGAGTYFVSPGNETVSQVPLGGTDGIITNNFVGVKGNSSDYKGCVIRDAAGNMSIYYTNGTYFMYGANVTTGVSEKNIADKEGADDKTNTGYKYVKISGSGLDNCVKKNF